MNLNKQQSSQTTIITPESSLRRPLDLLKDMKRDLFASRELAWRLLVRDIKAQYRQSVLGIFWAFIPPIITALGLTIASNAKIINIGATDVPYPAYVMFSMTLWQTFIESLNSPIGAVSGSMSILARINFPREAIILAGLGQVFFNFGIKLILIMGLFIFYQIPLSWTAILAPVALIHLIAFGTFIGLIIAPIGALYHDVTRLLAFAIVPWMLLTPVIYPSPKEGIFGLIVNLNPVTHLLVTTRQLVLGQEISNPGGFWIASAIAMVGLLIAWIFYRLAMPFIIERMSS